MFGMRRIRMGGASAFTMIVGALGLATSPVLTSMEQDQKPLVIVALGDSYASGEGNPDNALGEVPIDRTRWESIPCHRSAHAWPQLVADSIRQAVAPREVIFKSFACGGATIEEGILGIQPTNQPRRPFGDRVEVPVIAQVSQAAQWFAPIKRRHDLDGVDIVLLSIGGNDVGFANVIMRCMAPASNCANVPLLRRMVEQGFATLEPNYLRVGAELQQRLRPQHVFTVGYPDPSRDENGDFCHRFEDSFDVWQEVRRPSLRSFQRVPLIAGSATDNISRRETEYLYEHWVLRLNTAIERAADVNGRFGAWHYVDGMVERTRNHGYCTAPGARWFHTLSSSFNTQGDLHGTMHPTRAGHRAYVSVVVPQITDGMGWSRTVVRRRRPRR